MTEANGEVTVAERLGQLLDRGLLPAGGPAEAAERLIERLERPARIALLGLPGAGKSSILNLLAGTIVVPETLRLPTIIVQYGAEARMICTLADGRAEVIPGCDLEHVLTLNPALITLEMDLPALKVISLLEVAAGPMEAEQRRAAVWASKRADFLIWCTTSYLPKEQVVWDSMPDAVKDNGFLFLTKVDLLGSRDAAAGMFERVEMRAGEDFRQVLSISAKQARAAMQAPGGLDRAQFRDSGASAVITTIKTRVQMARRADTDMAELLLARHVAASGIVARRFAEPPVSAPAVAPPEPKASEPEVMAPPVVAAPEPILAVPEPEPEPIEEPEDVVLPEVSAQPEPEPERDPSSWPVANPAEMVKRQDLEPKGNKRFSDRIKQIPVSGDAAAVPPVPLRTTWKSPNEAPVPEPKPEPVPRMDVVREGARNVARHRSLGLSGDSVPDLGAEISPDSASDQSRDIFPESASDLNSETNPGADDAGTSGPDRVDTGPDDALIAAMIAAAAAAPSGEGRVSRARAALGEAAAPPATAGQDRAPKPADPTARLPAQRPPLQTQPFPSSMMDATAPRAAVLRERRPDPPPTERRERPRFAARLAAAAPAVEVAPPVAPLPVSPVEKSLVDQAIALIIARSAELEQLIDPTEKLPVDLILDHGRETTDQVIDVLSRGTSAELRRINADLSEVQDLIMLMQLEKGHAPADDAMTLILQLRRDLETLRAA